MALLRKKNNEHVLVDSSNLKELVNIDFTKFANGDISNSDTPTFDGVSMTATVTGTPANFRIVNGSGLHMHTDTAVSCTLLKFNLQQSAINLDVLKMFEIILVYKQVQWGTKTRTQMLLQSTIDHTGGSAANGDAWWGYHRVSGTTVKTTVGQYQTSWGAGSDTNFSTTSSEYFRCGLLSFDDTLLGLADADVNAVPSLDTVTRRIQYTLGERGQTNTTTSVRSGHNFAFYNNCFSGCSGDHEFYVKRLIIRGVQA